MAKARPYVQVGVKPISAEEFAAQRDRIAAEQAEMMRRQVDAEKQALASFQKLIPRPPVEDILVRLNKIEQVLRGAGFDL